MPISGRPNMMVLEPGANGAPPPIASLGNPANTTSGTNMTVSANPGSAGPAESNGNHMPTTQSPTGPQQPSGAPEQEPTVTVIWASATPIRLAVLKMRSGDMSPTDQQIENAGKPRPNYVIAVVGLPAPEAGLDVKQLAQRAFLAHKGSPPLMANDSTYRRIGNADVYFFHFTRASLPLTAAEGDVEFRMTLGKIEIRKKFDLRAMQYEGQLAL